MPAGFVGRERLVPWSGGEQRRLRRPNRGCRARWRCGVRGCGAAGAGPRSPFPAPPAPPVPSRSHRGTWERNSHRSRSCRFIPGPRNSSSQCAVFASAGFKTPLLQKAIHRTSMIQHKWNPILEGSPCAPYKVHTLQSEVYFSGHESQCLRKQASVGTETFVDYPQVLFDNIRKYCTWTRCFFSLGVCLELFSDPVACSLMEPHSATGAHFPCRVCCDETRVSGN